MKIKLALIIVSLLPLGSICATDYPDPAEKYVNDFARVITGPYAEQIRSLLSSVESQTGIEITVVTIQSLADQNSQEGLRKYAARLFDRWGVGNARRNNGVMLLFSEGDREVWIEAGAGYAHRHDAALQRVVDESMLPYFMAGDYSRGLYEGAVGVSRVVTRQVSWFAY